MKDDNFDEIFDEITSEADAGTQASGEQDEFSGDAEGSQENLSPEEIRKRAHGADSMRGRLEKEKEKARLLEEQMQKKAQGDEQDPGAEPEKDQPGTDVPGAQNQDKPEPAQEPEHGGESQPDQKGEPGTDAKSEPAISDDQRKKASEYDLIVQRLRTQQERNRQLEAMLSQGQAAQPGGRAPYAQGPVNQHQQQKPAYKKAAIPDELKDDATEFERNFPDYFRFLEEDSPLGNRMRNALRDYGPDQAALIAETKMLREEIEATRREAKEEAFAIARSIQEDQTKKHFVKVAEKHPEMAWRKDPAKEKDWAKFTTQVREWIETLPYRQAHQALEVADRGDTGQVIQLLDEYKAAMENKSGNDAPPKQENSPGQETPPGGTAKETPPVSDNGRHTARSKEKEELIRAAEAVPSRPAPPPAPRPNPDDYDAAWNEAVGDKR